MVYPGGIAIILKAAFFIFLFLWKTLDGLAACHWINLCGFAGKYNMPLAVAKYRSYEHFYTDLRVFTWDTK